MRKNKDQTSNDVFYAEHKQLCEKCKAEAKGLVKFNMIVTTFIVVILVREIIASVLSDCTKGHGLFWDVV